MNRFDDETRRAVFKKSNELCHLCWKPMAYSNYGNHGARGAWEIDHSVPRSQAGTDHMKELKTGDAWVGALSIGLLGARFFGPPGFLIGAVIGAIGAYSVDRGPG